MGYEKIVVSAPTYIKFGSTSAASGGPTLFVAINKRTVVTVSAAKIIKVTPHSYTKLINAILTVIKPQLPQNVTFTLAISGSNRKDFEYHTALVVATIGAVLYFTKHLWNPHEINKLAFEYLKSNRQASGGEVTAATFGGFIWERRELSYLNSIWQLPIRLKTTRDHFSLVKMKGPRTRVTKLGNIAKRRSQVQQIAEAFKRDDNEWFMKNLRLRALGENLFLCYDVATLKHKSVNLERIHLGGEGVKLEQATV